MILKNDCIIHFKNALYIRSSCNYVMSKLFVYKLTNDILLSNLIYTACELYTVNE